MKSILITIRSGPGWFLFSFISLIAGSLTAQAQQTPQYTQYIFSNFLLNPALTGIENYIEVKCGYRQQWVGLEDAPQTSYLSFHAPIGKDYKMQNSTSFGGSNPMNRNFKNEYTAQAPHHGLGFHIVKDNAGVINRTDIQTTYAYHLGLAPKLNIGVGVAAGISQMGYDKKKMKPDDINDPTLMSASNNQHSPLLTAGAWLYGPQLFLGLSANQILSSSTNRKTKVNLVPHYYATVGYKLFLAEEIALLPSIMMSRVSSMYSLDYNAKFAFRDRVWFGGSYRQQDSFSLMAGFNINSLFNVSYSYDYTISPLATAANGSHEIVVGLLLNNRSRVLCPQNQF